MGALILAEEIRDWVFLPISLVVFLVGVVRHYATLLIKAQPKADLKSIRESQAVLRAGQLRATCRCITKAGFRARRAYFTHKEHGVFSQEVKTVNPQAQMMSDPTMMVDMMKKNLNMIVPQMLSMFWVNFFFSGFVIAKIPFPLTQKFRAMLQRGVDLQSLDVTYVSSLSWYFLNVFCNRGIFAIIFGENSETDDMKLMQQQMAMGMDTGKAYVAERENLELLEHEWVMDHFERRAIKMLKRMERSGL